MSIGMILDILAQNRVMLIEAVLGNVMNCIVVYTLFGKRKYDWFFPAACAVRYIFYNIGLLSIWNAIRHLRNSEIRINTGYFLLRNKTTPH